MEVHSKTNHISSAFYLWDQLGRSLVPPAFCWVRLAALELGKGQKTQAVSKTMATQPTENISASCLSSTQCQISLIGFSIGSINHFSMVYAQQQIPQFDISKAFFVCLVLDVEQSF